MYSKCIKKDKSTRRIEEERKAFAANLPWWRHRQLWIQRIEGVYSQSKIKVTFSPRYLELGGKDFKFGLLLSLLVLTNFLFPIFFFPHRYIPLNRVHEILLVCMFHFPLTSFRNTGLQSHLGHENEHLFVMTLIQARLWRHYRDIYW